MHGLHRTFKHIDLRSKQYLKLLYQETCKISFFITRLVVTGSACFLRIIFAFLHRTLEIANAFTQSLAHIRNLARAEDQQSDHQQKKKFRNTQFATEHTASK